MPQIPTRGNRSGNNTFGGNRNVSNNTGSTTNGGKSKGVSCSNLPSNAKTICQICGRPYHSAIDCYQHMNHAYQGRVPPNKLQAMIAAPATQTPTNICM